MNEQQKRKISTFMSLVLRHKPQEIGLQLDENGWVSVTELLSRMNEHGNVLDIGNLIEIVATNDKRRFAFNENEDLWKATVAKYDLKWAQLLNNEKSGNNIAGIYGISQFPTKILIDPSGTIILNSTGEEEGFYKKLDELVKTF